MSSDPSREPLAVTGTLAGTGSFECPECNEVVILQAGDAVPVCPRCGAAHLTRTSLFAAEQPAAAPHEPPSEREHWLAAAKASLTAPGQYLAYMEGDRLVTVPLERHWTRIGRSLAADVRLDDATVSRRHALIVRQADGVRVLDDRSLNGVFVNGSRIEWSSLGDGDELIVGRYRLHFVEVPAPDA